MSDPDIPRGEDSDALAAEYALGVLDDAELRAARLRAAADPAFAREVEDWRARLAGLIDEVPAVPAGADIWPAVARRLEQGQDGGGVVLRLRRRLTAWRSAAGAAAALAAVLALALVWPRTQSSAAPVLTARLSGTPSGPAVFVALYDPTRRAIVLTPASVTASADRSPELWLIPTGGKPVALGVATFGASVQLISTAGAGGLASGVLAVSVEPRGGSPTGQPTGPVIATGQLTRL